MLLGDFNQFKEFNDLNGHIAGDALLKKSADAWRAVLREVDFVARWGGDEFAMLLPNCPALFAKDVIERLHEVTPHGQHAAFGSVTWDFKESKDELVARADAALYSIKEREHAEHVAAQRSEAVARAKRFIDSPALS